MALECPICGSAQLVPVLHGRPGPPGAAGSLALGTGWDAIDEWVCGDCGRRWTREHLRERDRTATARLIPFPGRPAEPATIDGGPSGDAEHARGAAPGAPSEDVGGALRRAREARGLDLEVVAGATGIWTRYLRALEEDEPLDAFPGAAYARMFLRDYAAFLDLDPEPLLRAHRARHAGEETEEQVPAPPPDPRIRARRRSRALAVLSAATLLALLAVPEVRLGGSSPTPSPTARAPVVPAIGPAPLEREPASSPAPAPEPRRHLRVVLRTIAACWVQATVDGTQTISRLVGPGERIALRGDRAVQLVLGNAGGASLRVNGERVPTGEMGEVVDLTFRLRDGVVRTERA